jgi:hypothetical protein
MTDWKLVPMSGDKFNKLAQDFRAAFHPRFNNVESALFIALSRAPEPPADPRDAEIAALRALVESAYREGWSCAHNAVTAGPEHENEYWLSSNARKALRGEGSHD